MWHIELQTVHNFGPKFSCWRQTLQFQRKIGIVNFLCSVPFNGFPFCSFFVFCESIFCNLLLIFSARRIGLYEEKPLTASFSGKQFDVTESLNGGPTWRCPEWVLSLILRHRSNVFVNSSIRLLSGVVFSNIQNLYMQQCDIGYFDISKSTFYQFLTFFFAVGYWSFFLIFWLLNFW